MKKRRMLFVILIMALLVYQASAGCGRWVIRETTDYLDDPLFEAEVAASTGPNATLNADGSPIQSDEEKEDPGSKMASEERAISKESPLIDVAGKWKIALGNDLVKKDQTSAFDLILIQSAERLQGYGTLIGMGSEIPATATGSVFDDNVNLDVKLVQQKKDYRIDLNLVDGTMEGSYELYENDELTEKGSAFARKSGS